MAKPKTLYVRKMSSVPTNFTGICKIWTPKKDGGRTYETIFFKDGKFHKEDGPAYLNEVSGSESYYLDGKHFKKETFLAIISPLYKTIFN